jgi:hypothetical protein
MDLEKEESWLNEMASKGYNFVDNFLFRYLFEEATPGEYIYRIELLEHSASGIESKTYIDFLKETGIECVATSGRWAYFRKKESEGTFDLYSDIEAKIKHYKRNVSFMSFILVLNIFITALNFAIAITKEQSVNFASGLFALFIGVTLIQGIVKLKKKIKELNIEKQIHE